MSLSGGLVEMKVQVTSMFLLVKPLLVASDRRTAELQSPITVLPAVNEPVLVEITT
jgi:hypothetical protein